MRSAIESAAASAPRDRRDSDDARAIRILARSLSRELTAYGLDPREMIELVAELLDHVLAHKAARRAHRSSSDDEAGA